MDMRFGMWNVKSLNGTSSLKMVERGLRMYKLDLVEYRRSKGRIIAIHSHRIIHSSMEKGRIIS
jgi:hypothetical protein